MINNTQKSNHQAAPAGVDTQGARRATEVSTPAGAAADAATGRPSCEVVEKSRASPL